MDKTVILVVDRDDDFGEKAGVQTPAIGIDACMKAATALAVADPEDSDSNALFSAVNIYRELEKTRPAGTFDIALICGDKKVGVASDAALVEEFDKVLEIVQPAGAILVGDGAEDEYIYPVISSRVKIDSVRKVYVKQAPGVEGTMYIISRYLKEPEKKRRFIAPLAFVIIAISIVYLLSNLILYPDVKEYVSHSTTVLMTLIIGAAVMWYCFDTSSYISEKLRFMRKGVRDGTTLISVTLMVIFIVIGIVFGLYSLDNVYTYRFSQTALVFISNALWPVLFAFMFLHLGSVFSAYLSEHTISYSSVLGCLYLLAMGLIINGFLDFLLEYVSVYSSGSTPFLLEIMGGVVMIAIGVFIRARIRHSSVAAESD